MNQPSALFMSELKSAVRDARRQPPARRPAPATPAPRPDRPTTIRLWLPLTPLFVLLAPFALIASPLIAAWRPARGVPPLRTALALGAVLMALSGTVVSVDSREAIVRIRIL